MARKPRRIWHFYLWTLLEWLPHYSRLMKSVSSLFRFGWPAGRLLKPGDRLVIGCDSITEQKTYSRLIEDYLTAGVPSDLAAVRELAVAPRADALESLA
jgi:hypothetical protein